jgi:DNA invertase Pin-like site-specific DNA recombinase
MLPHILARRTRAGMKAAKARGVHLGRPAALTPAQTKSARRWLSYGTAADTVAGWYGISRSALYRSLARHSR